MAEIFLLSVDVVFEGEDVIQLGYVEPPSLETKIDFIREQPQRILDVYTLERIAKVFNEVYDDRMPAGSGADNLDSECVPSDNSSAWFQVLLAFITCSAMSSLGFGGSLPDMCIAGLLGILQSIASVVHCDYEHRFAYE